MFTVFIIMFVNILRLPISELNNRLTYDMHDLFFSSKTFYIHAANLLRYFDKFGPQIIYFFLYGQLSS